MLVPHQAGGYAAAAELVEATQAVKWMLLLLLLLGPEGRLTMMSERAGQRGCEQKAAR